MSDHGTLAALITVECSRPGDAYALVGHGPQLDVHLAGPSGHGTGPCLCGFDRHAPGVGFSVGGGTTGPKIRHYVCAECARLAGDAPIEGEHAALFEPGVSA